MGLPSFVLLLELARQRPEFGLTRVLPGPERHICAGLASHLHTCTGVRGVVPAPFTARQCVWFRIVPSAPNAHCWPAPPLQVASTTGFPSTSRLLALVRHLPPIPT